MCGICGFTNAKKKDLKILKNMTKQMAHRGPDGEGFYINDNIAFGHRRLSLVDLKTGGQPIVRETGGIASKTWTSDEKKVYQHGDYAIVLNGEIYNHLDLRDELRLQGYEFETNSDTETVLTCYIAWGENFLHKLRGMFAMAIWNSAKNEMFCARDFFGIKPFYYTHQNGTFIFASEIKSILEHPKYKKEVNIQALEQYLCFQFSALEETFFKDIYNLPNGHYLIIKDGKLTKHRYWRPEFYVDKKGKTKSKSKIYNNYETLVNEINAAMTESVNYHNFADVEVGSLLSSGIDSSYNAALLSKISPSMKTFTVGFDEYKGSNDQYDGQRNEIKWAQELADLLHVENYSHTIDEKEYWEALPKIAWHMDEPNGDPSAVALYFVDKLASEHVKGVLSGEGADELFGGYTIYQTSLSSKKLSWIPKPLLNVAAKILSSAKIRGSKYLTRAANGVEKWYYTNAYASAFSQEERKSLLKKCRRDIKSPIDVVKDVYAETKKDKIDDCAKMQYTDLHFWILGDIFLKGDKMSMANSLECRVPFLDTHVFDIARSIPTKYKISNKQTKIALRDAAAKTIPQQWASKKKLGFPVPMVKWLRQDKYYKMIKKEFSSDTSKKFFNMKYLKTILDEHKNGQKDNSRKIWIVYMFLLWHKVFFEK